MKRHLIALVIVAAFGAMCCAAGTAGASSGSVATVTLHPGQSKKIGIYTVVCTARTVARTRTRIVLHPGFAVTVRGVRIRCLKAIVPTPAPIPAPIPTPPPPAQGTRENPYPLGSSIRFTKAGAPLWTIKVVAVQPDAGAAVIAANQFNTIPAGLQDFMVTVQVTYDGPSGRFDHSLLAAVGASGIGYTVFGNSCGVVPQPKPGPDIFSFWPDQFAGSTLSGNVCWQIPAADASSLLMYVSDSSSPAFFALR